MYDLKLSKINLKQNSEVEEVEKFLESFNLILDKDVDYTVVLRNNVDKIVATCSKAKTVFKCFAVSSDLQGEGVTSTLITDLIDRSFNEGIYHNFIFTKPQNIDIFSSLNFKLVQKVEKVALLERGIYHIETVLKDIIDKYSIDLNKKRASIVMNCNPFTKGHRYLIEKAALDFEEVLVFIVQEDKSLFPFKERYELVKKGVEDLQNVKVIPGTEYIISSATFPSYFLRKEDERLRQYTKLDASVFGKYFCRELNIRTRLLGEEPYCKVTRAYNVALKEVLKDYEVKVIELKRKEFMGEAITASKVRDYIKKDRMKELEGLVPKVTFAFLNTKRGKEIVENIKKSNSPH
ncbi:[citrate (pro-3S)-lyase] ligase [Haloimpatiens sp. FM7315]|uniref:[citrate (pro-3S)-lyase] ligase n=1 Tax=Haloimpatiens sp. FM7315 TaxID=3298609 RepID=UPI0035A394AB